MKKQVRRVDQRRRLLRDRGGKTWMRVAERGNANARDQVEIPAAGGVVKIAPTSALKDHGIALVDLQHMLGLDRHHVVRCRRCHCFSPLTTPTVATSLVPGASR
jgi:hypothetical protein